MDTLGKTWKQTADLWQSLAPSQRLSLVVAPLLLLGGFAYLLWGGFGSPTMTPLAFGRKMTDSELDTAEGVLIDAGLSGFERHGNQLLAPADRIEEYHGVLAVNGGMPSGWAEEFGKRIEQSSVFTSAAQQKSMHEVEIAKEIRHWLRALPGVVDGNVVWARSQNRSRFSRDGEKVTATITLKPKPGTEISAEVAESLRRMLVGAVSDLEPEDVVVFSTSGRIFTADDENDPFGGKLVRRIREFSEMYRKKVEVALGYIPNVLVTVHVDVDNVASSRSRKVSVDPKLAVDVVTSENTRETRADTQPSRAEPGAASNSPRSLQSSSSPARSETDTRSESSTVRTPSYEVEESEFVAAMPTGVQVSVGIPEDYYESAVANTGVTAGADDASKQAFKKAVADFKTAVQRDVSATVARAIGAPEEKISVTSYVRVDQTVTLPEESFVETASNWARVWGGTLGLSLFAVWALWMVVRSGPMVVEEPDEEETARSLVPVPVGPQGDEAESVVTARDELQNNVRDNPELAAAVIGKWIRAAK